MVHINRKITNILLYPNKRIELDREQKYLCLDNGKNK